jgi:hypothetical protein
MSKISQKKKNRLNTQNGLKIPNFFKNSVTDVDDLVPTGNRWLTVSY